MYSYIWIEGEKNLDDFCMKRFGYKPRFLETIGTVSGNGAFAKIHLIYKYPAENETNVGCHEMYFLFMEHSNGKYYYSEIEKIMRWNYEQIRTDKTSILKRRG